ncbi:hypothetical protein [Rhodopirellula europaea]|uniref:Secreted protein n=1 Tax=Rhodopirellula europaea SH398 TaxID=1263868 RepID=M5SFZ2_9BACT|nr:hypothetical protein [Rhodopirellula europaea]EMI25104.1 secreted protein [Rhodopirellula europaea SH398]
MQKIFGCHPICLTAVCAALIVSSVSPASAQSDSPVRLIDESELPTGEGLASPTPAASS